MFHSAQLITLATTLMPLMVGLLVLFVLALALSLLLRRAAARDDAGRALNRGRADILTDVAPFALLLGVAFSCFQHLGLVNISAPFVQMAIVGLMALLLLGSLTFAIPRRP